MTEVLPWRCEFAIPALYGVLDEESFQYTIRIPANDVLMVGRPSYKPKVFYESFRDHAHRARDA